MPAIVRIVDLVKNYYMGTQTVHVLKGLNLAFDEGDFVALMGPSGSGKSTLLNVLGCLDRPTSGSYFLGDVDVAQMSDDQLSEVRSTYLGFIFQSHNLLPQYTVVENVELPLLYQGIKLDEATKARCVALAEMVGPERAGRAAFPVDDGVQPPLIGAHGPCPPRRAPKRPSPGYVPAG